MAGLIITVHSVADGAWMLTVWEGGFAVYERGGFLSPDVVWAAGNGWGIDHWLGEPGDALSLLCRRHGGRW